MKKYMKPTMEGQMFVSNEFVSACGDSGTTYLIECNAPAGNLYTYYNDGGWFGTDDYYDVVKGEDFSATTAQQYDKHLLGSFDPCPVAHEANSTHGFYWGFIDYNKNKTHDSNETVIVWRGQYNDNGHATKNLNMNDWSVAKS